MSDYQISFEDPWYLLLWPLLVPLLWIYSYRGLIALGAFRRWLALALRTIVVTAIIFALADVQAVRVSQRLTVIYLLDQSMSVPLERRRMMIEYVNAAIRRHRQDEDRVGVIVFGRDATIEIPPFDEDVQVPQLLESQFDPNFTDLAGALRLAQASFPEDAARRIVLVSDGNENLGDVAKEARALAAAGVGIDVMPIRYQHRGEVILERLAVPSNIRKGRPFDLRVVINNTRHATADGGGAANGRLVVRRSVGAQQEVISEEPVRLEPGKQVFTVRQTLEETGFSTYTAEFLPDTAEDDAVRQNNRASGFAQVRGKGHVLLIKDDQADQERQGEFARLVQALKEENLDVTEREDEQPFANLAELQQYDTVILGNVPRERFTDSQIRMLVRNTQQMGAGLVMLGGPSSFGAGGWTNTELEKAMPVDFQIKNAKIVPRGALAMIMHASEMGNGNFWQKKIGEEALKALGPRDYCGVIQYGMGGTDWLWKPGMREVGGRREFMLRAISRMTPGDMPDFDPGLVTARRGFAALPDAAVKHMIIISDGDPSPPSRRAVDALVKPLPQGGLGVTISTVAVGTHGPAGSSVLRDLAENRGNGRYYAVRNANALPKIFQREARRVAQPLVYENSAGFSPQTNPPHEMILGIDHFPPITGYVMTTKKSSSLVQVALLAPEPAGPEENRTLLAGWTYGLGRAVAFTSDTGHRYTSRWTGWENYNKFFSQMIVWSMRPVTDEDNFSVSTDIQDGQVRVVVTALDRNDDFLNFLDMAGTVVGPDLEPVQLDMDQVAPGRYMGTFPGRESGSYFVMVSPGPGKTPIRTGVDVPYSDEFRGLSTNQVLLDQLAGLVPEGVSEGGRLIDSSDTSGDVDSLLAVNTFRHDLPPATSAQDAWFYLVMVGCCFFFFDVFVRRVHVGFGWVPPLVGALRDGLLGRERETTEIQTIERLRNRKAQVEGQVEQLRASARFEPSEADVDAELVEHPADVSPLPDSSKAPPLSLAPDEDAERESYTERLLRAKKKAWEAKKQKDE